MRYVTIPVLSKRSHADKNIKHKLEDQICKYLELDTKEEFPAYFISFTEEKKIGVNPQFRWGNPIGVYCYPLRGVSDKSGKLSIPFAGNRPFIQVLKINTSYDKVLFDKTYNKSRFGKDTRKLEALFKKNVDLVKKNLPSTVEHVSNLTNKYVNSDVDTQDFAAVIKYLAKLLFKTFRTYKEGNSEIKNIWCYTHVMAYLLNVSSRPVITWNKILRYLGYEAVVDSGVGYIHIDEPCQAVFLVNSAYKNVDMLLNKSDSLTRDFLDFSQKDRLKQVFQEKLISWSPDKIVLKGNIALLNAVLINWPKTITVDGNLNLEDSRLVKFSDNVHVTKDLDLIHTNLTSLGNVTVGRDLNVDETDIRRMKSVIVKGEVRGLYSTLVKSGDTVYCIYDLPDNLTLDTIRVRHLKELTSLPSNLTITDSLFLGNLPNFRQLPENLHVGDLYLADMLISELPKSLIVDRDTFIKECVKLRALPVECHNFMELPDNLTVKGNLELMYNLNLTTLPTNLHVAGELNISKTSIKELPNTLVVKGRVIMDKGVKIAKGAKLGSTVR